MIYYNNKIINFPILPLVVSLSKKLVMVLCRSPRIISDNALSAHQVYTRIAPSYRTLYQSSFKQPPGSYKSFLTTTSRGLVSVTNQETDPRLTAKRFVDETD